MRWPIVLFVCLSGILACFGFYGLAMSVFLPEPCGYKVLQETPSPDGKLKIVLFERDCGAFGGPDMEATVLPFGERLTDQYINLPGEARGKNLEWTGPRVITASSVNTTVMAEKPSGQMVIDLVNVPTGYFSVEPVSIRYESRRK